MSDFHGVASVEMLLLLLWRHVSYFAEGRHINNPSLKTTTAGVMRHLPAAADEETFRMEAAKKLAPALTRLSILDLVRVSDIYYTTLLTYVALIG